MATAINVSVELTVMGPVNRVEEAVGTVPFLVK
jgi:hypothetical protein